MRGLTCEILVCWPGVRVGSWLTALTSSAGSIQEHCSGKPDGLQRPSWRRQLVLPKISGYCGKFVLPSVLMATSSRPTDFEIIGQRFARHTLHLKSALVDIGR